MQQVIRTPRAARYEMSVPLRYRQAGEESWRQGRTVNISSSGLLFESPGVAIEAPTRIEFVLTMSTPGIPRPCYVRCLGRVVRDRGPGDPAVAATIESYDFLRAPPEGAGASTEV